MLQIVLIRPGTTDFDEQGRIQGTLDIPLNERGQIITDLCMRTATPGIFAAGDVRHASVRQLVASAGDGATAALTAVRYLQTGEWGS